jgi:hypothetical protein
VDDGFHRSPLVPGCLKVLKYLFPRAVRAAQCHPSNELNRFGGAAQNNRRAGADTQLWSDWKVRHDALTQSRGPSSRTEGCLIGDKQTGAPAFGYPAKDQRELAAECRRLKSMLVPNERPLPQISSSAHVAARRMPDLEAVT